MAAERQLRQRSRRWSDGVAGGDATAWSLQGPRAWGAQILGLLPPTLSLGIPLWWGIVNIDQLNQARSDDLLQMVLRTFLLGIAAALLAVVASLMLAIAKRWIQASWLKDSPS